eukprot:TRINITY_DN41670_c0_g1_i1.p1 TRINITY_DN41670_c0_g1~~TRINITY_DN41670_c0_g1_i1.p1  ORF type:complete len:367 (+),score=84.19 TRINITY_DN41670_c0_g1_i1:33-1133(+)
MTIQFGRLQKSEITPGCVVLPANADLPSVVRPASADESSVEALKELINANRQAIVDRLHTHGAVLFRGFGIRKPIEFQEIAQLIEPKLGKDYLGTSPRNAVTEYTFTASELPGHYPIPQHLEMSFLPSQPPKVFFCCLHPSLTGGETPLCDFSRVYADLPDELKQRFNGRDLVYTRNYASPTQRFQWDATQLKQWPQVFETTDKAVVERINAADQVTPEWRKGGGLRLTNQRPAVILHPRLGRKVFANHTVVFHPTQAHQEYLRVARLTGKVRHWLFYFVTVGLSLLRRLLRKPGDYGMNVWFADGKDPRIKDSEMAKVRDAVWRNMIIYRWQLGDVVAIDNTFVSHGRLPYTGKRSVLVAWGTGQ